MNLCVLIKNNCIVLSKKLIVLEQHLSQVDLSWCNKDPEQDQWTFSCSTHLDCVHLELDNFEDR